ncbi:MAG: FAD-dependent oxidoreductase [Fimbriimonadaceae bacterium]|nr:FAD-dependent oxidoreductase [Fimbriimonadaceae bacterium]QYK56224.1 MAG: FAD-dependent oxidoreductase [Fimbriimonadaceae bacterium]
MRVAVVGAGIMGLCTARALADRGHQVVVFEKAEPGNRLGSTSGRSRIVRQAYPDRFYSEILLEGHALWQELEQAAGKRLVHAVGLLYIGPRDEAEIQMEVQTLSSLNQVHKLVGPEEVRSVSPTIRLQHHEIAIHTLEAGWADVPAVLDAVALLAMQAGAEFATKEVSPDEQFEDFDRAVVTVGPWVTRWGKLRQGSNGKSSVYGESSNRKQTGLAVTLQTYAYVRGHHQGPVWIEGFGDHLYGFPNEPGKDCFKIGLHSPGPVTDPDDPHRIPDRRVQSEIKEAARRRFDLKSPEIIEAHTCPYTTAPNDDFKIGWRDDKTLLASPCSGHGFKFGPWMGQFLADLAEGKQKIDAYPRWHWKSSDDAAKAIA